MTRYPPLSLAVLLLLLVVTPAFAFVVAAPNPTTALSSSSMKSEVHGIVDNFHHYHHSIAQVGEDDYGHELKRGTIWQGLTVTETFVFTSIVTTRTIFKKKTIRKTKTTWKTKTAKPPRPSSSAITLEEAVASGGGVVTSTTTVTVTTTADTTRRGRVKRHEHGVRFNGFLERAETTTAWTVTSTALAKKYETATKTKYTATITKFIATTTRFTTITPSVNTSSPSTTIVSGMPAQVSWVTVTETTSVMPYDTTRPKNDAVHKGAIAGGVIAGVVAIAGLIGACFFMRRRTNKRFSQRKSFNQNTAYSSVSGGSLGDDMGRPEAEGLMGGGPLTPGTPAVPGLYSSELAAPPPIPNIPTVIPPSSSTSLRTNPSPTQTTNPAIAEVALPAPAGRRQENYAHLSPPIASSEFRPPGTTTTTPRRPRANSLATNIMPPPLQQYTASRSASGATTLRQEGTGNHSRSSSLYSQDDGAIGAGGAGGVGGTGMGRYTDAPLPTMITPATQKETGVYVEGFVSPLTPPMPGATWDIGDRVRKAASPSATPLPFERPRSPDLEMQQREHLLRQGEHRGY
ncbi:hypothetical protein K440DRAFT_626744 [Wilcoxina mikolae CBS 423.85]|nr:hypothetical protein K440DRAFT_626744 [Wilcoxina mikolae CBS 423.85]